MRALKALLIIPFLLPFGFVGGGLYVWLTYPESGALGPIWVGVGAFTLLLFLLVFGGIAGAQAKKERVRRDGFAATAVITALADTGVLVNHQPQMRLDLDVQPPIGQPYAHSVRSIVPLSMLGQLRPGTTLNVHIDRDDVSNVVLEDPERLIAAV